MASDRFDSVTNASRSTLPPLLRSNLLELQSKLKGFVDNDYETIRLQLIGRPRFGTHTIGHEEGGYSEFGVEIADDGTRYERTGPPALSSQFLDLHSPTVDGLPRCAASYVSAPIGAERLHRDQCVYRRLAELLELPTECPSLGFMCEPAAAWLTFVHGLGWDRPVGLEYRAKRYDYGELSDYASPYGPAPESEDGSGIVSRRPCRAGYIDGSERLSELAWTVEYRRLSCKVDEYDSEGSEPSLLGSCVENTVQASIDAVDAILTGAVFESRRNWAWPSAVDAQRKFIADRGYHVAHFAMMRAAVIHAFCLERPAKSEGAGSGVDRRDIRPPESEPAETPNRRKKRAGAGRPSLASEVRKSRLALLKEWDRYKAERRGDMRAFAKWKGRLYKDVLSELKWARKQSQ